MNPEIYCYITILSVCTRKFGKKEIHVKHLVSIFNAFCYLVNRKRAKGFRGMDDSGNKRWSEKTAG